MQHKIVAARHFSGKWSIGTVLVQGKNGKFQGYLGVIPDTAGTGYELEKIVSWGTPLSFDEAKKIFSNIKDLNSENYGTGDQNPS